MRLVVRIEGGDLRILFLQTYPLSAAEEIPIVKVEVNHLNELFSLSVCSPENGAGPTGVSLFIMAHRPGRSKTRLL
jgi:hypothetical protein